MASLMFGIACLMMMLAGPKLVYQVNRPTYAAAWKGLAVSLGFLISYTWIAPLFSAGTQQSFQDESWYQVMRVYGAWMVVIISALIVIGGFTRAARAAAVARNTI